ncbi:hypothetical protein DNH61_20680 [Paenibacillus sambharensis]|uniref:DUF5668 domain-containing protein n=1 Tax=Paenibacillus sambharensis TaxID=1803190 RepID=A0A2W1LFS1_9BACL|nr:hypothetical protein [Paenibacillus sambharensis]PZD93915.1 hypothetical protein DNH61_20680 [Paenibacillus sambharensis]
MSKNQYSVGILILAAGVVILLGKLGVFSFIGSVFWPLFLLIPGILLHVLYFGRMLPAVLLIPAGMLSVYSLLFLFCNLFGWTYMRYLWPLFLLGAAVGLYEFYLFDSSKSRTAFVSAVALGGSALLLFAMMLLWGFGIYLIAVVLIVLGAWMAFGRRIRW